MTKEELKKVSDEDLVSKAIDVEMNLSIMHHKKTTYDSDSDRNVISELINRFQHQRGALSAWKLSFAHAYKESEQYER